LYETSEEATAFAVEDNLGMIDKLDGPDTYGARCICIHVGSPLLFEAECRTPQQMQLANAFCRYLGKAQAI
jgi:hypothetical protein